ncbi:MAG: patatin-like phospholipase family protein [Prochlorotrichaceae cyanobacterium]|jgi:patatin-like phospholipase/acyl hydrolase
MPPQFPHSRRQFVQTALAAATFTGVLKLSAGCSQVERLQSQFNLPGGDRAATYNILCCDGGGLKGLITAIILERLEAKLAQASPDRSRIKDHFQLFAGTSTGSIIACGLAKGIPATDIRRFYQEKAPQIFPDFRGLLTGFEDELDQLGAQLTKLKQQVGQLVPKVFKRLFDPSRPVFEEESLTLETVLQEVFGATDSLDSLDRSLLAVAYDAYNRKPILLGNGVPQAGQLDARKANIWQVCRASSAVPGVFTSFFLDDATLVQSIASSGYGEAATYQERSGLPLIDGAVVTNNPSLWAIQEARAQTEKPLLVVSLGTGQMRTPFSPEDIAGWGLLDWFNPLKGLPMLEVMFSGNSDTVNSISRQLLDQEGFGEYLRYQPDLNHDLVRDISAFVSNADNLVKMETAARLYLEEQEGDRHLDELVQRLLA